MRKLLLSLLLPFACPPKCQPAKSYSMLLACMAFGAAFILLPYPTFAQVDISTLTFPNQKIPSSGSLEDLLIKKGGFNLVTFAFFLAGMVFFFNLLYAGWDYLLSTGDPGKTKNATSRLINAFIGFTIVLGSFIIIRITLAIIGLPDLI